MTSIVVGGHSQMGSALSVVRFRWGVDKLVCRALFANPETASFLFGSGIALPQPFCPEETAKPTTGNGPKHSWRSTTERRFPRPLSQ